MDRQGGNISVRTDLENHPQIESYCDFSRQRAETCDPDCESNDRADDSTGGQPHPGLGHSLRLKVPGDKDIQCNITQI